MSNSSNLQQKLQTEIVELTKSINDIISNFKQLKNPIQESQVKVPMATNQLDKISEQTEAATNHMLDLIENISIREEEVIKGLNEIKELLPKDNEKINNLINGVIEKTNVNVNDAFTIMNALQFQDITAQQMNHAAALLEEIETKLTQICQVFGIDSETPEEEPRDKKERVYDPHADLYEKKTEQQVVDSMFDQVKK